MSVRRHSLQVGSAFQKPLVPDLGLFTPPALLFEENSNLHSDRGVGRSSKPGVLMFGHSHNKFLAEVIMKRSGLIFGVIALTIMLILPASANDIKKQLGAEKYDRAVENLLMALKETNTNDGLRGSAIYQLGELQAEDAVIPLMAVLRRCHDDKCRIAAAWALCKIGDARGVYAVKQAVRFDDSQKVKLHSAWYYNLYVSQGTFAFIPSETAPTQIAELR